MKQRKPKMRETDRLIHNIALCLSSNTKSVKNTERYIREDLHVYVLQSGKSEVELLREMLDDLKKGRAHQTMNRMVECGIIPSNLSNEEFEMRKGILRNFQRRSRHIQKTKKEMGVIQ